MSNYDVYSSDLFTSMNKALVLFYVAGGVNFIQPDDLSGIYSGFYKFDYNHKSCTISWYENDSDRNSLDVKLTCKSPSGEIGVNDTTFNKNDFKFLEYIIGFKLTSSYISTSNVYDIERLHDLYKDSTKVYSVKVSGYETFDGTLYILHKEKEVIALIYRADRNHPKYKFKFNGSTVLGLVTKDIFGNYISGDLVGNVGVLDYLDTISLPIDVEDKE